MKVYSRSRASLRAAALVAGFLAIVAPAWGQVINEDFKLLPSDGAQFDAFGYSIAIVAVFRVRIELFSTPIPC